VFYVLKKKKNYQGENKKISEIKNSTQNKIGILFFKKKKKSFLGKKKK
jgi:hypothetical protein